MRKTKKPSSRGARARRNPEKDPSLQGSISDRRNPVLIKRWIRKACLRPPLDDGQVAFCSLMMTKSNVFDTTIDENKNGKAL
jgi:hypothetical protein